MSTLNIEQAVASTEITISRLKAVQHIVKCAYNRGRFNSSLLPQVWAQAPASPALVLNELRQFFTGFYYSHTLSLVDALHQLYTKQIEIKVEDDLLIGHWTRDDGFTNTFSLINKRAGELYEMMQKVAPWDVNRHCFPTVSSTNTDWTKYDAVVRWEKSFIEAGLRGLKLSPSWSTYCAEYTGSCTQDTYESRRMNVNVSPEAEEYLRLCDIVSGYTGMQLAKYLSNRGIFIKKD